MPNTPSRSSRQFRKLAAHVRAQHRLCCRCGQAIDYTLEWPNPASFSVEHIKPWSTHPHLRFQLSNLDAAHLSCNSSRGNAEPAPTLGQTSRDW